MKHYKLPEDFIIGASTSAWQTEGWHDKQSHQDTFIDYMYKAAPERWHNGIGTKTATDFYHQWESDIELMAAAGLAAVRISIDWSRFVEDYETAAIYERGAEFYDKVIDKMLSLGVQPLVCLEHWELPSELYKKYGGYASPKVVEMYTAYASKVFARYQGKIKHWWTFNEPIVIPQLCFMDGYWYPYIANTQLAMQWIYGKILCNAKAVQLFKEMNIEGTIGIILNPAMVYARSTDNPQDKYAQEIADLFYWKSFMDPSIKGEFPEELLALLTKENSMFTYTDKELTLIKENTINMLGINYYQPLRVMGQTYQWSQDYFHPQKYFAEYNMPGRKMNPWRGWEIYPKGIYDIGMRIKNEYGNIPWMVTENGLGVENEEQYKDEHGIIQDDYRIEFISEHLQYLIKAVNEGSNCRGYLTWNWMDNVSVVNSLKNRYGLIELDLANNLARRPKKSAYWFRRLQETREFLGKDLEAGYK